MLMSNLKMLFVVHNMEYAEFERVRDHLIASKSTRDILLFDGYSKNMKMGRFWLRGRTYGNDKLEDFFKDELGVKEFEHGTHYG